MAQLVAAGDRAAVSDLTRLECRVKPIRLGDASLLADYDAFFAAPDLLGLAHARTDLRAGHGDPCAAWLPARRQPQPGRGGRARLRATS